MDTVLLRDSLRLRADCERLAGAAHFFPVPSFPSHTEPPSPK